MCGKTLREKLFLYASVSLQFVDLAVAAAAAFETESRSSNLARRIALERGGGRREIEKALTFFLRQVPMYVWNERIKLEHFCLAKRGNNFVFSQRGTMYVLASTYHVFSSSSTYKLKCVQKVFL